MSYEEIIDGKPENQVDEYDTILFAIGRYPDTKSVGLHKLKV